ncbi:MAG TPA: DNA mismatch repair endonuclease MutH [Polyangiaceae bacterium]|nr:DNA mismatch repair endonuclease MutH [Polyangiaceae bacterium]
MESSSAPQTESELLARALELAGSTLGELGERLGIPVPAELLRAKGWFGQALERALGATARSRAAPDFEALGVELKTLPVGARGLPCESTFVCTIDLSRIGDVDWSTSLVKKKLSRVLWVPVEGAREIPIAARRIGTSLLWSPSVEEEDALRFDWEELAGIIGRGDVESITGHLGRHLQVRPKAASSRSRRRGVDGDGASFATLPRGFYLRASFTARILAASFGDASQYGS